MSYTPLEVPERFHPDPEAKPATIHTIGYQTPLYWAIKTANLDIA